MSQGRYETGLAAAEYALRLNENDPDALNAAGVAYLSLERNEEALASFEKATQVRPDDPLLWTNLGAAYRQLGRLEEAEVALVDHALELNPSFPMAYIQLARVYLAADRADVAAQMLQTALETGLSPDSPDADDISKQVNDPNRWLAAVDQLLSSGDAEGALSAIDQAEALGASANDVAVGKAAALIQLESWTEAKAILEPALEASPNDPRLHNSLGIVYRELGEVDLARQHFERASVLAPDWEEPKTNLEGLPAAP